jgi:hypothetical protein
MTKKVHFADKPLAEWPIDQLERTVEVIRANPNAYETENGWEAIVAKWEAALAEARTRQS